MKKIYLILFSLAVFTGCQKEEIMDDLSVNSSIQLSSVSKKKVFNFVKSLKADKKSKSSELEIFDHLLSYEPLKNSQEEIAVIPAQTRYQNVNSRLLLINIDGELKHVYLI